MHVDDGARNAGFGDTIKYVIDKRAATQRHERLGKAIGSRTHARAETGRKDHG
jgi:hypothetical protein